MDVLSPCVRLCTLDDADVCIGCGRHIREITDWAAASLERKREILDAAARRLAIIQASRGPGRFS